VAWLECWDGLPRSGGIGLPVEVRVVIFDAEVAQSIKDSRSLRFSCAKYVMRSCRMLTLPLFQSDLVNSYVRLAHPPSSISYG
jgi:hypothetical protein